ncbi:MAG: methyltransferase [Alphaproteobacteria bacterium]|nr:methyltransferase [Alphaproteobacteria bacterium]
MTIQIANRADLRRVANHLANLTQNARVKDPFIAGVREVIADGHDPLGDTYARVVSPSVRRNYGATFTPIAVVQSMLHWAKSQRIRIARIVDPGAGSGRFVLAAARAFPNAEIVAVEKNSEIAKLLQANVAAADIAKQVQILVQDYRSVELSRIAGATLFIGNPPYVRHHDIEPNWKNWYTNALEADGLPGSQLAGLHLHFLLKTRQLAVSGDLGCFITAAEWLDVNYGSTLRAMLTNGLGGQSLHLIDPAVKVFDDALTSAMILCFTVGLHSDALRVRHVRNIEMLGDLRSGKRISLTRAQATHKWSLLTSPPRITNDKTFELGNLFAIHRGQVTGMNRVWIAATDTPNISHRFLVPTVTDAKELIDAPNARLMTTARLKRVVSLPADLNALDDETRCQIDRFLRWARSLGANKSYVAQHRRPWWRVALGSPAPILMTYMGRRPPVFVRNICGARIINIAHGLYPRTPLAESDLNRLVRWLNANVCISAGRTYAGGLTKFEPREAMRLRIPTLEALCEMELN